MISHFDIVSILVNLLSNVEDHQCLGNSKKQCLFGDMSSRAGSPPKSKHDIGCRWFVVRLEESTWLEVSRTVIYSRIVRKAGSSRHDEGILRYEIAVVAVILCGQVGKSHGCQRVLAQRFLDHGLHVRETGFVLE